LHGLIKLGGGLRIHRQGGMAIAAHPFRSKSIYSESELFETGLDAIECKGIPAGKKAAFFDKIRKHAIPCVSNSDAHNVAMMETSWVSPSNTMSLLPFSCLTFSLNFRMPVSFPC